MRPQTGLLVLLASFTLAAQDKIMKTLPGPGSGELVDGLRASITPVKNEFGPGESIMVVWKLSNEGAKSATLKVGRNHVFDFGFQAKRDGIQLDTSRREFNDYFSPQLTLEAGESITKLVDLRMIHIADSKWSEPLGQYEVVLVYLPKQIRSGAAKFRITAPGEQAVDIAPELAERIQILISQLGHDEYRKREEAHKALFAIGKPALRQLQEAADGKADPEIANRAKRLLEEIRGRSRPIGPVLPVPPPPPPGPPPPPPPQPPPDDEF